MSRVKLVDLSVTLPGGLDQVLRWGQEYIRASDLDPEIMALVPRLQMVDGDSITATGTDSDGVVFEGRLTVKSQGSLTRIDLSASLSAVGDGILESAENAVAEAAMRMELTREWPATRDKIIAAFQRWQATGVVQLPEDGPPAAPPGSAWPDGVDWSDEALQYNRAGWPTEAQKAQLEAAMPVPSARHWWRRRVRDPREPFQADLADGRCAIVQGVPQKGETDGDGIVAGVALKGLGYIAYSSSEIQVFYWPHTGRVMNWSFPPSVPTRDSYQFTLVRRSETGQELDRAVVTV